MIPTLVHTASHSSMLHTTSGERGEGALSAGRLDLAGALQALAIP